MALQKQLVTIPLGVGIDTKSDPKLVSDNLLSLENAIFTSKGQLKKRFGMDSIGHTDLDGNEITNAKSLTVFQNELGLITDTNYYAYSSALDSWINKSPISGVSLDSLNLVRNQNTQSVPDVVCVQGISCYVYEDSGGGICATIVDQNTNSILINNYQLSTTGICPKVTYSANNILIYYVKTATTTLACRTIPIVAPITFTAEISVTNDINATVAYDICKFASNNVLVYRSTANQLKLSFLVNNGRIGNFTDGVPNTVTYNAQGNVIAVTTHFNGDIINDAIYVTYFDPVNGLSCLIFNTNVDNTPTPVVLDAGTTVVRNITSVIINDATLEVFYELAAAQSYNNYINVCAITRDGVISLVAGVCVKGLGLVSKAFTANDSGIYFVAAFQSQYQSTSFLMRRDLTALTTTVIARMSYQNCGGLTARTNCLTQVSQIDSLNWLFANVIKTKLNSESGILFSNNGISRTVFNFDTNNLFSTAQLGLNLHIGAGMLLVYDGAQVVEAGFNLYPENIAIPVRDQDLPIPLPAGNINAGVHLWCFVYEWTDAQGQMHRSAPSIPISINAPGSSSYTFTIPTLRITAKQNVKIVTYRTVVNGIIFYKVSTLAAPTLNDITVDSKTFQDNISDATLIGNELLYTTGQVLSNIAPPACTIPYVYNNRLVLAGLEDSNGIWFSKEFIQNEAVSFSDTITTRIDQGKRSITGITQLDEKIVFFKDNNIYLQTANGPTNTGFNNDIGIPQSLATDVGCISHKSIVITPQGIMFKSKKGYYQLDRSLQLSYIGAPVESFNNLTCSGAVLLDDTNQIRFTNSDGNCLVYDYYVGQWGVFTNYKCVASKRWNGGYVIARQSGRVDQENKVTYLDNDSAIKLLLVTPWIKLASLQGFQRIYESLLIGQLNSPHNLRVRIGYNYDNSWREDYNISTVTSLGNNPFGAESPFGNSSYFGGSNDSIYQFKINNAIQKCESIRFEFSDYNNSNIDGSCMNITALTLVFGKKIGAFKIAKIKNI
jgi:hypothetical protein